MDPTQQQFSDLPAGATVASTPNPPQTQQPAPTNAAPQYSDLPPGASVISIPDKTVQRGFGTTALKDVGQFVKGAFELPGKAVAYGIAGQPHDDVADALEQQQEAHKKAVYQQFANDFHAGNYQKAFSGLVDLFDPKYGDPNDPLQQLMSAQWKSSADAKNRMLEAAKQGDALGVVKHAAGIVPIASQVDAAMENYRKQPTRENLAHVVTSALPAFIPSVVRAASKVAPAVVSKFSREGEATGEMPGEAATKTATRPGIVRQIVKGPKVAQPGAQEAVRGAVRASAETAGTADESLAANIENQPILKGGQTVLDEQLDALEQSKKVAYKKVDDTVGFDLKAEKQQLANDKYKLSQLGNTDADVTQRGNLIEAINDSTDRIAEAEGKLKKTGIDPREADTANQRWMAGKDFRKALVKNTNADGSVNVDGLLKDSKNLRNKIVNGKPTDRLQQFMGPVGADKYMEELQKMQELGAHAMKARKVAAIIGVPLASTVGGGLAYKAVKALAE